MAEFIDWANLAANVANASINASNASNLEALAAATGVQQFDDHLFSMMVDQFAAGRDAEKSGFALGAFTRYLLARLAHRTNYPHVRRAETKLRMTELLDKLDGCIAGLLGSESRREEIVTQLTGLILKADREVRAYRSAGTPGGNPSNASAESEALRGDLQILTRLMTTEVQPILGPHWDRWAMLVAEARLRSEVGEAWASEMARFMSKLPSVQACPDLSVNEPEQGDSWRFVRIGFWLLLAIGFWGPVLFATYSSISPKAPPVAPASGNRRARAKAPTAVRKATQAEPEPTITVTDREAEDERRYEEEVAPARAAWDAAHRSGQTGSQ